MSLAGPSIAPTQLIGWKSHKHFLPVCNSSIQIMLRCSEIESKTLLAQNSPYTCLGQTSKFHYQVSFSKYKAATFYIKESQGSRYRRIPTHKECKCEVDYKRVLVVKFAHLKGHFFQLNSLTAREGRCLYSVAQCICRTISS